MNLDQLQVFMAVAKHLHFSRAAEDLYITQPAVSASVSKLEGQYGVKLFHRIGRRVELTDAGEYLQQEGSRLLDGVDLVERGLQDFNALKKGELHLAASLTVGNYWLPSRLKNFCDQHNQIELRCTLANAEQVIDGTLQGKFDLCFVSGDWGMQLPQQNTELHLYKEEVGHEHLQLVVGKGHPWFGVKQVNKEQLANTPWVMREQGSGAQQMLESALKQAGTNINKLNVVLVLNSSEMVKTIALQGGVSAALPETMIQQEVALGLLWPIEIAEAPLTKQPIWMLKNKQRYQSELLRTFEQVIREGA